VDNGTGVIYGATQYGGGPGSYGTVFALTPAASGYTERQRRARRHAFGWYRGRL
jgi:hypothetical protein